MRGGYSRGSDHSSRQEERPLGEKNEKGDGWWWERASQGGKDPGTRGGKVIRSTCEKFSVLYFYWFTFGMP